jgi:hypothetical protein
MFTFEEQYENFKQLSKRTKEAYEFWYNVVVSSWEDLFKHKQK